MSVRRSSTIVAFVVIATAAPHTATAVQYEGRCEGAASSSSSIVPVSGTPTALLILAELPDEKDAAATCTPDPWPKTTTSGTPVPGWAHDLLDTTFTSSIDSSLTDYFALMSKGSPSDTPDHILLGDVYPYVILLADGIDDYADSAGGGDMQAMTDVLDSVDANIDFSAFDTWDAQSDSAGSDGVVDFVFILFRQPESTSGNFLFTNGGIAQLPTIAVDDSARTTQDGALCTPPVARRGYWNSFEIMAHEYGHYVFNQNWKTDAAHHLASMDRYAVMTGMLCLGNGPVRASTFSRYKAGWISPAYDLTVGQTPLVAGSDTTIELQDVLTEGDAGFAVVRTQDPDQYFILECVDSTSTYLFSADDCTSNAEDSGLMIYHVAEKADTLGGSTSASSWLTAARVSSCFPPLVEPEIAGGMYDSTSGAPDPIAGVDRISYNDWLWESDADETDQYRDGVGHSNMMTPYTNPNTNLYWYSTNSSEYYDPANCAKRQSQEIYSGLSFYNIHWTTPPGNGQGVMEVTIRYDGTAPPEDGNAVPADMSWQGKVSLMSDVAIAASDTLEVADGTEVVCGAYQDVFDLGALDNMVEVLVDGTLKLDGATSGIVVTSSRDTTVTHRLKLGGPELTESPAAAGGDWFGAKVSDPQSIVASGTTFRYATGALNYTTSTFPDLTGHSGGSITFDHNLLDVTFDRDVEVDTVRVVPQDCVIGLAANGDAQDLDGIDPDRVEVIVRASAGGSLTLESGATLRSSSASPVAGDWYGIRTSVIDSVSGSGGVVQDARGAIAYEADDWPSDYTGLTSGLTLQNNVCDFTKDRDYEVSSGTLSIPSGWTVGFRALADSSNGGHGAGMDTTRCELILNGGQLDLDGVLRSDDPNSPRGTWYGVRTTDVDDIIGTGLSSGGSIEDAGGAISLEDSAAVAAVVNDASFFSQFSGKLSFSNNQSDICVDRDMEVGSGDTWTVPPGWRMGFTANHDAENRGVDSGLAEVIVNGTIVAGDTSGARGAFVSNASPALASLAAWYGVRDLEPYHVVSPGYGYTGVPSSYSSIENEDMEGAKYALSLEALAAPGLNDVDFLSPGSTPANPTHIYLNGTDVVVPVDKKWSLNAGTYVTAKDTSTTDYDVQGVPLGESGLVDLIVQGALVTKGTSSNAVTIGPETGHDSTCTDWGGIYMDKTSGASVIDNAEITYAANPIFFYYPSGNPKLTNSTIQSFADVGVWVLEAQGSGMTIKNNTISRLSTQGNLTGGGGCIFLEKCASGVVDSNTVVVSGPNLPTSRAAVRIKDTVQWCFPMPVSADTLHFRGNTLQGPGEGIQPSWSGLRLDWACRQGSRGIDVSGNVFFGGGSLNGGWSKTAIDLEQSAGARVECNQVQYSKEALQSFNNGTSIGTAIVAVENSLLGSQNAGPQAAVVRVGHGGSVPGGGVTAIRFDRDNYIRRMNDTTGTNSPFVVELDEVNDTLSLDAENNTWAIYRTSSSDSILTDESNIQSHIEGDVDVSSFLSTDESCFPGGPAGHGTNHGPTMISGGPRGAAVEDLVRNPVSVEGMAAVRTDLAAAMPTPFRELVRLRFAIGPEDRGRVTLTLFNVAGRRVATLVDRQLEQGVYDVAWDGRSTEGTRVAAGVYFARLQARDTIKVRKVVRLR